MTKQNGIYQTAKGSSIDMNKLINKNELTIAVGNMKVNARGDKIGSGGQVLKATPAQSRKIPETSTDETSSAPAESPEAEPKVSKSKNRG